MVTAIRSFASRAAILICAFGRDDGPPKNLVATRGCTYHRAGAMVDCDRADARWPERRAALRDNAQLKIDPLASESRVPDPAQTPSPVSPRDRDRLPPAFVCIANRNRILCKEDAGAAILG